MSNYPYFMQSSISCLYLLELVTGPYSKPDKSSLNFPPVSLKSILISSYLFLGLLIGLFFIFHPQASACLYIFSHACGICFPPDPSVLQINSSSCLHRMFHLMYAVWINHPFWLILYIQSVIADSFICYLWEVNWQASFVCYVFECSIIIRHTSTVWNNNKHKYCSNADKSFDFYLGLWQRLCPLLCDGLVVDVSDKLVVSISNAKSLMLASKGGLCGSGQFCICWNIFWHCGQLWLRSNCEIRKCLDYMLLQLHRYKICLFYILLTVHLDITSRRWPTWRTILLYNMFISVLYMFRANTCSSSGGQLY